MQRRQLMVTLWLAGCALGMVPQAQAQAPHYPTKPVRLIVPFPAGGATDLFARTLSQKLGVGEQHITPGFEDTWYYLWRERRLPVNVDPFNAKLDDEMERARLRRVFEQKLDSVVGYVLPITRAEGVSLAGMHGWSVYQARAEQLAAALAHLGRAGPAAGAAAGPVRLEIGDDGWLAYR